MAYKIVFRKRVLRDIKKLDPHVQHQVLLAVKERALEPFVDGSRLSGDLFGTHKIKLLRLGIRVIYVVENDAVKMIVLTVGKRSGDEVYRIALEEFRRYLDEVG
ncbi:MAG: hypothetical protein KGL72_05925 [Actinomycetales bacterium]|nr:hypothetical protein [Actinomycetales bacterium]